MLSAVFRYFPQHVEILDGATRTSVAEDSLRTLQTLLKIVRRGTPSLSIRSKPSHNYLSSESVG
jgi:hypothetical protein